MPTEEERDKLFSEMSSRIKRLFYDNGVTIPEGVMILTEVLVCVIIAWETMERGDGEQMIEHTIEAIQELFKIGRQKMQDPEIRKDFHDTVLAAKIVNQYFNKG